jgi:hypothetical protein
LNEQRLHTPWQQKVFTKLLGLDYKIVYRQGVQNRVADALSRRPSSEHLLAISSSVPQWLEDIVASYTDDEQAQDLISKLSVQPSAVPQISLVSGVIQFNNRIWLSKNSNLQPKLMAAFHNSAVSGHSGIPATYHRMKQYFYWPGMKAAIQSFVKQCPVCQQAKPDRARYPGLLQPLPVPDTAWEVVSMDFVEGLPRSGHYNCILVVVDKLTKFAHFIPLRHPFTALTVAKTFLDNVYKLHGMPLSIISDRDQVFTSKLWKELFGLAGVKLHRKPTAKPRGSTNAWKLTSGALCIHAQNSGQAGCPWPNSGTTPACTPHWDAPHSRSCMVINPVTLVCMLLMLAPIKICHPGCVTTL